MAQVRQDNVQIKLEIDGSQSKTELDNLTRRAQLLQTGLKEMKRGTDEYITANKELREVNSRMTELRDKIGVTGLTINNEEARNQQYEARRQEFAQRIKDALAKRLKDEAETAKKNRLELLKEEEAALKERLARVAKDSEAEMRIKQQLVTNEANQKLTNDKLTRLTSALY